MLVSNLEVFMLARLPFAAFLLTAIVFTAPGRFVHAADAPSTQPSNDVSGTWKWTVPGPGGDLDVVLKLKQDGDKLTGTMSGFNGDESPIADGKIQDGQVTFKVVRDFNGNQITTKYTATFANGELKGKSETIFAQDFDGKRDGQ
jgi:hypothetical protein